MGFIISGQATGSVTTTVPGDSNAQNTTLLLPGNGTNGAQNNTFLDGSTNNFTITRNGNTTQGTFSPYGPNWSTFFGASTSNRISAPANAVFAFGTGSFTVEAWIYITNLTAENFIFDTRSSVSTSGVGFSIEPNTGKLRYSGNANNVLTSTGITANTWYHVAWVYNGTTLTGYINGVSSGTATPSFNITQNNGEIGNVPFSGVATAAYLSNVRVVKGTAVYTSNFTPSTTSLTAISGTSLLACQSNRFIDNSSNAFAVTINGTPTIQRFSPFSPTQAYSTSTIGGSGYFDGSGDYLTLASSTAFGFGTGDFTIEYWIYPSLTGNVNQVVADFRPSDSGTPLLIGLTTGGAIRYYDGTTVRTGGTMSSNTWNHVAWSRASNVNYIYLNGVQVSTYTATQDFQSSRPLNIGSNVLTSAERYIGYLSNFRVVKGTAVYTTTFTPPTAPVTAITNTSLLTNFTNAGIIDNAMMTNLETVGNAQISTAQSKFGGGSMSFDGNGDKLFIPSSPNFAFGTGDFTVEAWVYLNAIPNALTYPPIFEVGTNFYVNFRGNGSVALTDNAVVYAQSSSMLVINTWYHVAVVRASGSSKVYINGTGGTAVACAVSFTQNTASIGGGGNGAGSPFYLNGYIDDLRITKGYARYTTTFTPPTSALSAAGTVTTTTTGAIASGMTMSGTGSGMVISGSVPSP